MPDRSDRVPGALSVLVVAPWARRLGGAEEMLWSFLRTYPRELVDVSVVFLEEGAFEGEVAALGIRTDVIDSGRLRSPRDVARTVGGLAGVIRRRSPDVVLNWMAKTQLYGGPAAGLSGRRPALVWWQHLTPVGHWMDRMATALPAAAVGASSRASAKAQEQARPRRPVFHVHPGIDLPAPDGAAVSREDLGLSREAVLVTLVGRLQPWKGQAEAIRALHLLRRAGEDVQMLIVGGAAFGFDVNYRAELELLTAELGLFKHLIFTGQVDSAHPYLRLSDVALNASRHEPFGIVVLEALANGVAAVAVDGAGPSEILEDGRTGLLTPDGSPEALAAAIGRLARDPALRTQLGAAGREHHRAHFTAAVMSQRIAERLVEAAR